MFSYCNKRQLYLSAHNILHTISMSYDKQVIHQYSSVASLMIIITLFMVALCNRADHYIFIVFLSSSFFFLLLSFSSPNLSSRRLDVYHTLAHGVALVQI